MRQTQVRLGFSKAISGNRNQHLKSSTNMEESRTETSANPRPAGLVLSQHIYLGGDYRLGRLGENRHYQLSLSSISEITEQDA